MSEDIRQLPTTRKSAIDSGLPFYFTGKPCVNGHLAKRNTLAGSCVECIRQGWLRQLAKEKMRYERAREARERAIQEQA